MQAQQQSTVVGVFEDRSHADEAIRALIKAGFRDDQIGAAMRYDRLESDADDIEDGADSYAESGAMTGALAGLGLGALTGLGVLSGAIPILGPAIAAGTLGVIFSNAVAGAGIAGLVGTLIGAGIPHEEAKYYQTEFEAGRTIVTVHAKDRRAEATSILRAHGAYDMSVRESSYSGGSASHRQL